MEQEALKTALRALDGAVDAQSRAATVEPRDLYGWGAAFAALIDRVDAAASVVAGEVGRIGDEVDLRDDMGVDPQERLAVAREQLDQLRSALGAANLAARGFHSSIGHVGRTFNRP